MQAGVPVDIRETLAPDDTEERRSTIHWLLLPPD
jgi:hypothetical protein